ncbi:MAG: polysaccharide deacetylase family protein [Clostridia bacterium]|nr:polysaccharide deacetylase family protein [Clostridia bacterium]
MNKYFKIIMCIIAIVLMAVMLIFMRQREHIIQTSSQGGDTNFSGIDNKKIGWGIKRALEHQQPDVGSENSKILRQYDGLFLGDKDKKNVYLTFDSGYEAGYTEKILEVLGQNDVKATFFLTEHYINSREDLVKRMIDEGHIIGNHTSKHKSLPDISEQQIKQEVLSLHTLVYEKFGYEMKYIRPPKGEYSQRSTAITNSLGYKTVMWSLAYDDWDEKKQGREEYGKEKIIENIHNGAIILLHGTSKDNSNILDYCIKEIKNMGYEFKNLDQFE